MIPAIRPKPQVRMTGASPQIVYAMFVVSCCYARAGYEMRLTSVNDSLHSRKSKHWRGDAFDSGTKEIERDKLDALVDDVRASLPAKDFDVILEHRGEANEHLHVEFDPKA